MFSYQRYRAVIHSGFHWEFLFFDFVDWKISTEFQNVFRQGRSVCKTHHYQFSSFGCHFIGQGLPWRLQHWTKILEFWRNHNGFPKLPIITRPKPNPLVRYIEVIIWLQEDMNYMFSWHWKIISLVHCVHSWENRSEFARNAKIM